MQIQTFHPLPGAIFNSEARNAGNNRARNNRYRCKCKRRGKYEKFPGAGKKQQSETQPSLFPLAMPRRRPGFTPEMENIAIRRIID